MAWETHNQRRYFYRVVRVDGRVTRLYYGNGSEAEAEAARLAADVAARAADNNRLAALQHELEPLDEADAHLDAGVTDLIDAVLLCAGLHKHRGQWRQKMDATKQAEQTRFADPSKPTATPLEATLELARRGRREILPKLRAVLDTHPELWQQFGDLAAVSQEAWLTRIAGGNQLVLESARRQAEAMQKELAGDRPSPLENLISERVAAAWLAAICADVAAAAETGTGKVATYLIKRAEVAHRQFHNAARSLALVRRLLIRPVMIVKETRSGPPAAAPRSPARQPTGGRAWTSM